MSVTQKIILVALLALGVVCLAVGFSLVHYIGGFLRTVEEEARDPEKTDRLPPDPGSESEERHERQQE